MYFGYKALEELQEGHLAIACKCQRLADRYPTRDYKDKRAREYAVHGFLRRLKTLARCIDNVFGILPPGRIELPSTEELFDAMINIQAFVFNVFGSFDNLAWIWVREKPVRKKNGSPISKGKVGLGKDKKFVRDTFSPEFREYLNGLDDWFDHVENFRHALAHKIPLYIPPYMIPKDKEAVYRQLEELQDRRY